MDFNCSSIGFGECDIDGLVRYCFEIDDDIFECDCPSWWGYTGEFCDESSGQLIYYRAISLFFLHVGAFSFFLDLSNAKTGAYLYRTSSDQFRKRMKNARLPSLLILGVVKNCFFAGFLAVNMIGSFTSGSNYALFNQESVFFEDYQQVYPVNGRLWLFFFFGTLSTLVLQSIEIFVSWIALLNNVPDLMITFKYHKAAVYITRLSPYLGYGYTVVWMTLLGLGYFLDVTLLTAVIAVSYVVVISLARRAMKYTLLGTALHLSKDDKIQKVSFLVLRSSALFLFSLTGIIVSAVFGIIGGRFSINFEPGSWSLGMFGENLAAGFGTIYSYTVSWYVAESLNTFTSYSQAVRQGPRQ